MSKDEKGKNAPKPKLKNPIEVIFEWQSPERIWSPKDRTWYLFYAAVFAVFILISARLGAFIMILGLLALMFLWFVQATIEPLIAKHQITNRGIITREVLVKWEQLEQFWISDKSGIILLYLDYKKEENMPRITMLINPEDTQILFNSLIEHLKYATPEEAEVNFLSNLIYGNYYPVSEFLQDLDEPQIQE